MLPNLDAICFDVRMAKKKVIRKRPSQQRSKLIFESMIEAAQILLSQEGLDGFTTNKVAKKAGVSIGSLYQYFPNKETILESILKEIVNRFSNELETVSVNIESNGPADFIEQHLISSWESCLANPLLMRSVFQNEKSDELIRHMYLNRWHLVETVSLEFQKRFKLKKSEALFKTYLYTLTHSYMGIVEALCYQITEKELAAKMKEIKREEVLNNLIKMSRAGLAEFI